MTFRLSMPALAALALAACSPSAPPAGRPGEPAAATPAPARTRSAEAVLNIHHALLIPGSELLYSAESAPPEVAAAWTVVQQGAAKVAQGADQLAFGRPDAADSWTLIVRQLAAAASASAAAAAAANPEQLRTADEALAAACTACHQAFARPQP